MRGNKTRKQNGGSRDERVSIPAGNAASKDEPARLNQIILPDLDFSKRSHQAAFWMLLNTVIYSNKL